MFSALKLLKALFKCKVPPSIAFARVRKSLGKSLIPLPFHGQRPKQARMQTPMEQCSNLSEFLSSQMELRLRKNSSYSLRAFARDLGLAPSHLSGILKGSDSLSEKKAEEVSKKLKLKRGEKAFLLDLILASKGRTPQIREQATARVKQRKKFESYRRLKNDEFRLIADWYHAAIPELLAIRGFEASPETIAESLGITRSQADEALGRLERLKLISRDENGVWKPEPSATFVQTEIPSAAIRRFHRQILERAIESTLEGTPEERFMTATILALPESALREMNERINSIVAETYARYENEPKEKLFAFAVHFFPIRRWRKT